LVVGFHFREILDAHRLLPNFLNQILKVGYFGVDIFFVLSGFVVGVSANRAIKSGRDAIFFLLQRYARIFLGYWPALFLLYIVMHFAQRPPDSGLAFTSIFLLSPHHTKNWLNVAWSLTYELYFYLLVVALFLLTPQAKRLAASVVVTVFILIWNWLFYVFAPALVFSGVQPGAFWVSGLTAEFFFGVLFALKFQRQKISAPRLFAFGAVLVTVGLSFGLRDLSYVNINFFRALSFGCAGLGCVMIVCGLEGSSLKPPRWLVAIGDASFSVYLLHIIFLFALGAVKREGYCGDRLISCDTVVGFWPLVTVFFSVLWFRWIEKPLYERVADVIRRKQTSSNVSSERIAAVAPNR
jgi:exopolysaccharide production protein ExoZ